MKIPVTRRARWTDLRSPQAGRDSTHHERGTIIRIVNILLATLITLVVSIIALLPPIVHFFTGPIAPAIGGFAARRIVKISDDDALIMGGLLVILAGIPAYIFLSEFDFLDGAMTFIAAGIAALYVGGLATFAALFASDEVDEDTTASEPSSQTHDVMHAD